MKPNFGKFFALALLVAFLAVSSGRPATAQSPEPPVLLENGEFPTDLYLLNQTVNERRLATVEGGENGIDVASTWWSASGTTFVPSSSTVVYAYGGEGCVDTGANFDIWRGSVNIPNGSTITGMYFNYQNDVLDPADTTIYLRRYRYSGTYDDILHVTGTNTDPGNHTHWTGIVANNLVDNYDYAYVLVWSGNVDQNLCGVNLQYTPPPIYLNALPLVRR